MIPVSFSSMSLVEQHQLHALASALPGNPVVVEIGAFIGGSLAVMHQARPDAKFIVIEDFLSTGVTVDPSSGISRIWYDLEVKNSRELFLNNTAHIDTIELHEMHGSTDSYTGRFDDVRGDLVFDDAGLTDMDYWVKRVKPGGIFCFRNYAYHNWYTTNGAVLNPLHMQKVHDINALVQRLGTPLNLVDTFFWIVKPVL